ncbi:MAG: C45 family peptidase [Pusillimonas sp.]
MLSLIELSGSPYQCGFALGRFGAASAHDFLINSPSWHSVMSWRGSETARHMAALVEQHFPLILQELQGLADGLDLPFEDVLLWNCRGDVWSMSPDGCTTVQLPSAKGPRITHNEDGDPGFAGHCGIGLFKPDNAPSFASFVYPASLPGHTFAANQHGLAITVNNLRSRQVSPGVPRMVLCRALLEQASLESCRDLLDSHPKAGGFHLSMAQKGRADLLSVEFNARGVSTRSIDRPGVHANHIIHPEMSDFPQVITDSSRMRQARGDALLAQGQHDPLRILADRDDPELPIYRDAPDDSDNENTMATADFRVGADAVVWQVYERPGLPFRYQLSDAELASE